MKMRTKAKLAAAVLAAAALLAGCTTPSGGTAAIVNGQTVTVAELDDAMTLAPYLSRPIAPGELLVSLVQAREILQGAAEHGVAVSTHQAEELLDQMGASTLRVDGEYPAAVIDITKVQLVAQEIEASGDAETIFTDINERLTNADIELNPRYRAWQGGDAAANGGFSPWIESRG